MDYSFLVGVHHKHMGDAVSMAAFEEDTEEESGAERGGGRKQIKRQLLSKLVYYSGYSLYYKGTNSDAEGVRGYEQRARGYTQAWQGPG